ncbi:Macrolide export protein MacA [subsurface metagenome]
MRIFKIMLIGLVLGSVSLLSLSCAPESDSTPLTEYQVVTVQRGNLVIDITAVGNLALSLKEDLAFDIFYEEAAVEEVLVEEGDTVEEGQMLAKLDTSEWEDELTALEDQVTTTERNLLQAEINLRNTEIALDEARDIYTWTEIEVAQHEVDSWKVFLQHLIDTGADISYAQARLDAAEAILDAMISDYDTEEVAVKKLEVELAQGRLEDAQKALEDAQEALDEAKSESPVIIAPFDGFITRVNVEGGDEVLTGTVAVQLADPTKFEADLMVSEMDILQVKLGGEAWVQVDAMPGLSLPAKVTHISPTATIQSGVVNYEVKVKIQSLQAVMQERQQGRGEQPGEQQGQMPTVLPEDFQLREGLTVTVSILVEERNDALLVPNGAIIRQGMETYVQVLKDGVTEARSITTGISNWQYTEVTDGLSEGEKVVIPETTTTTSTTEPGGHLPFFPGRR